MSTMKQVADKAGVSTTTVSHVINSTRAVSDETKERVESAIRELNYIPSAVARSLKNDCTHTIGMMIPNNSNPYFAEVIQGIEDACYELGYNIILCNCYDDPKKQADYTRVLMGKRIDGLIIVSSGSDPDLKSLLASESTPLVLVDREVEGIRADFIEADHEDGGYQAGQFLLQAGHRKIACVAGPLNVNSVTERVEGFKRALREHGLDLPPEYLVHSDFTSQGGFSAFKYLLNQQNRPTAIFACNDLMAIGGICAANEAGIEIPRNLSVVGYDDIALASFSTPPLTTVSQPKHEIGRLTAKTLVDRIRNPNADFQRHLLKSKIVVRLSCDKYLGD